LINADALPVLALAVAIDLALGDPPNAIHPVAWMGGVISFLEKIGPKRGKTGPFIYGFLLTLFTAALFAVPVYFLLGYLQDVSRIGYIIVAAVLLKLTFSIKQLRYTALKIRDLLTADDLDKTRFELRALVSRDRAELPAPMLASAAVESVAEGTGDSLVAPLFFFLLLGVPGAIAYRAVNTVDSMIGYHGKYEYLGKFAARLDDLLNFIPARLAALFLVIASAFGKTAGRAWKVAVKEHSRTESPNAGWPISAMAGGLGVRLKKPGHYVLGEAGKEPDPAAITGAVRMFSIATLVWLAICLIAGGIRFAFVS
jgi:adenosylcobinamide-phosphate synthase